MGEQRGLRAVVDSTDDLPMIVALTVAILVEQVVAGPVPVRSGGTGVAVPDVVAPRAGRCDVATLSRTNQTKFSGNVATSQPVVAVPMRAGVRTALPAGSGGRRQGLGTIEASHPRGSTLLVLGVAGSDGDPAPRDSGVAIPLVAMLVAGPTVLAVHTLRA
jgi:hypothetical protein